MHLAAGLDPTTPFLWRFLWLCWHHPRTEDIFATSVIFAWGLSLISGAAGLYVLALGIVDGGDVERWVGSALLILGVPAWGSIVLGVLTILTMTIGGCIQGVWESCVGMSSCVTESWSAASALPERTILVQTPGAPGGENV